MKGNFVRIAETLVNMAHIVSIETGTLKFFNGEMPVVRVELVTGTVVVVQKELYPQQYQALIILIVKSRSFADMEEEEN